MSGTNHSDGNYSPPQSVDEAVDQWRNDNPGSLGSEPPPKEKPDSSGGYSVGGGSIVIPDYGSGTGADGMR